MLNTKLFLCKRQRTTFFERRTFIEKIPNRNRVTVNDIMPNVQIFKVLTVETN